MAYGLGSTRALTDGAGTVTATYAYDAFGALRASTGTGATEFRFAGQQDDAAFGYQYLRARYYDPTTGRFISKDPVAGVATRPPSQHPYSYALNSPVNYDDPTGEFVPLVILGVYVAAPYVAGAVVGTFLVLSAASVYAQNHPQEVADFANGCLASGAASVARVREPFDVAFAHQDGTIINEISRIRRLTKDERQELGRAVEDWKTYRGIPKRETLTRGQIEEIADDEGLDNRP
jgi:RHS repeat-associated protein